MFFYFLQGAALALPSTVVPSPLKIFLISAALENGWKRTAPACFVPLVTDGLIIVLALFLLVQMPDWFLDTLRLIGGIFILYLAGRTLAILRSDEPVLKPPDDRVARQSFFKAVGVNFLNPNPYLLWGVIAGPIVLQAWRDQSFLFGLSFIVGFYLIFVSGLIALVIIFAKAGELNARLHTFLTGFAAIALLLLGIFQIVTGTVALLG